MGWWWWIGLKILSEVWSDLDFKFLLHEYINNVSFTFLQCPDPDPVWRNWRVFISCEDGLPLKFKLLQSWHWRLYHKTWCDSMSHHSRSLSFCVPWYFRWTQLSNILRQNMEGVPEDSYLLLTSVPVPVRYILCFSHQVKLQDRSSSTPGLQYTCS